MSRFTDLPTNRQEVYERETAAWLNVAPQIVEKDFWVCWTLRLLFSRKTTKRAGRCQRFGCRT